MANCEDFLSVSRYYQKVIVLMHEGSSRMWRQEYMRLFK